MFNSIKEKLNKIIQDNEDYQKLINNASIISNLQPIPALQRKYISPEILTKKNSNITKEKATLIIDLLPINDLFLEIIYGVELKTKKEYFLVPTTNYLWIISKEGYNKYNYKDLKVEIIKNGLITKVINLSNYIFEISNSDEELNNFINIINNQEFRDNLINDKYNKYGNNEINRIMNNIGSGISYNDINIRFYSLTMNRIYRMRDIDNYELLIDNSVVQEKRLKQNARLTSNKNSCYEMKIRITPKDKNVFIVPILNRDEKSTVYSNTSDTFINNLQFGKTIMNILDEINEKK